MVGGRAADGGGRTRQTHSGHTPETDHPLFTLQQAGTEMLEYSMPFLWLLYVLLICFTAVLYRKSTRRSSGASHQTNNVHDQRQLATLAHFAQLSYRRTISHWQNGEDAIYPILNESDQYDGRLKLENGILEVFIHQRFNNSTSSKYRILQTYMNHAVWLLQPLDSSVFLAKWIIVFRGTKVFPDMIADAKLTASVAGMNHSFFRKYLDNTYKTLKDTILTDFPIHHDDPIVLVGHSLGGTIAEAMMRRLRCSEPDVPNAGVFSSAKAVVFDSPGLPDWFRRKYMLPQQNPSLLTMVYGQSNIVNQLTKAPEEALAYRVGNRYAWNIFNFFNLKWTMEIHYIGNMIRHIEEGDIERDTWVAQNDFAGRALRGFCRIWVTAVNFISFSQGSLQRPTAVPRDYARANFNEQQSPVATGAPPVNGTVPLFQLTSVADIIATFREERQNGNTALDPHIVLPEDVTRFSRELNDDEDIVCPLIGLTSCGKTSLLKALCDMEPDDDRLAVAPRMDVTTHATTILWKETQENGKCKRLWLMDMRGVRGEENSITTQLHEMRCVVQCALYVTNSATAEPLSLFREIQNALESNVLIVFNDKNFETRDGERDRARLQLADEFNKISDDGAMEVMRIVLRRSPGMSEAERANEKGVGELRAHLLRWISVRREEIGERAARERSESRKRELLAGTIMYDLNNYVGAAATTGTYLSSGSAVAIGAIGATSTAIGTGAVTAAALTAIGPIVGVSLAVSWSTYFVSWSVQSMYESWAEKGADEEAVVPSRQGTATNRATPIRRPLPSRK